MKRALACCALIALLASPVTAHAERRPTAIDDYVPWHPRPRYALDLELGWYTDSDAGRVLHVLTPAARFKAAPVEHIELELDWATVVSHVFGAGSNYTRFLSGNPTLAGYAVYRLERGYFRIGAAIAAPIVDVDPGRELVEDMTALSNALATRGMYDAWLYAPDTFGLIAPARFETLFGHLLLGADAAAAVLIPTDERIDDETDLVMQGAGTVGVRADVFTLGASLQLAWFATGSGDNAQLAAVPFAQIDVADALFFYARGMLNLDEPLGLIGGGRGVWGLFAGAGARF